MNRARNRAQSSPSPVSDPNPAHSFSPCSKAWYVLNTLSSSQHVFSLQFFISNIHLSFGLLSNVMWMETRCLFWTQQNKRRVTEPILPQSKLVLTATPTVGDRLCGTGPVLIWQYVPAQWVRKMFQMCQVVQKSPSVPGQNNCCVPQEQGIEMRSNIPRMAYVIHIPCWQQRTTAFKRVPQTCMKGCKG